MKQMPLLNKVIADKEREVKMVMMAPVAYPWFSSACQTCLTNTCQNQIHVKREDIKVTEQDLLETPKEQLP
jgi:malate synthase